MEEFVVGRIIDLGGPENLYTIMAVTKIDETADKYLIVVPASENSENASIQANKPAVVKVIEESQELEFINDMEIIKKVLEIS
jgi:uncharacterized protein YrzB (UPF0473 family)